MKPLRLIIFRGRLGWYWRLVAGNNRVVAIGGEPFATAGSARRSFNTLIVRGRHSREFIEPQPVKRRRR